MPLPPLNRKPASSNVGAPLKRDLPQTTNKIKFNTSGEEELNLTLPTSPSGIGGGIETTSWLMYGQKRIGKSSLAANFPGAVVFAFEAASDRVKALRCTCTTWAHFLKYIELYKQQKKTSPGEVPKVAVIDTGFEAYLRCKAYVCKKAGVSYTSEANDHGGIWDKINDEFRRAHAELTDLGMSLIVICHEQPKEVETRAGQKFDMIIPKLSKQADDYYRAAVQNVIYLHYRDKQRWIALRGSDYLMAGVIGDEDDPVFMTPSGEKIHAVFAGDSAKEAFENLNSAFNCEQENTYENESDLYEEEQIRDSIKNKQLKATKKKF